MTLAIVIYAALTNATPKALAVMSVTGIAISCSIFLPPYSEHLGAAYAGFNHGVAQPHAGGEYGGEYQERVVPHSGSFAWRTAVFGLINSSRTHRFPHLCVGGFIMALMKAAAAVPASLWGNVRAASRSSSCTEKGCIR